MDDLLKTLNANSGAIVAAATVASVTLTLLLLLEARTTRNLRREALVDAKVSVFGVLHLELVVTNYGPANARDVEIAFEFRDELDRVAGTPRRQGETLLGPGDSRRFLPSPAEQLLDLNGLAAQGLRLVVELSWTDDRRRLWFLPTRRKRQRAYLAADLVRDLFGGWALTERDPHEDLHAIAEKLGKVESHLRSVSDVTKSDLRRYLHAAQQNMPDSSPLESVARRGATDQGRPLRRLVAWLSTLARRR
ncbi:MAG: hypothetical protein AB1627_15375 [Chloroflexota bacterium]